MLTQSVLTVALLALSCMTLVSSNPYGPTYNDAGYDQPSYQPAPSYGHAPAYQPPAPAYQAPAYQAPAYPKYHAPSSAHHTQYDNYYPKQSYSKPVYAPPKPYAPPPSYQQPAYPPPKPAYPAPSYGGMDEYKAARA